MKLALAVGNLNVEEALDTITPEQLREWRAFDLVCPIGPDRLDDAAATFMTAMIRYVGGFFGDKREELRELTPDKFLPHLRFREEEIFTVTDPEKQSEMELIAARVNMEASLILAGQGRDYW